MTHMGVLRSGDYARTRWKNDGGWTTQIARSDDPPGDDFHWRVSIAEIETDGPFSSFPGVARDLLLLEGNGIELDIDDHAPLRLSRRFERAHFKGESRVQCRLLAGATRDFNVMARSARRNCRATAGRLDDGVPGTWRRMARACTRRTHERAQRGAGTRAGDRLIATYRFPCRGHFPHRPRWRR
jgi:environmental stress-induced protein Ves